MTFDEESMQRVAANAANTELREAASRMMNASIGAGYSYNFSWLGRPIIQYPQDILAMQEIIWRVQPDLIIETGIAHGGSLIFSAAMLELNAACGGPADAKVLGLDIDIRAHNRSAIEAHSMSRRIAMIEGSSVAHEIVEQVRTFAADRRKILVCLDSNHTHAHVLAELEAYAPMVTQGSYCVVFDTIVEDLPKSFYPERPWGPGDNPRTAVRTYLRRHPEFEIDRAMDHKLLLSVAPEGYLLRIGK